MGRRSLSDELYAQIDILHRNLHNLVESGTPFDVPLTIKKLEHIGKLAAIIENRDHKNEIRHAGGSELFDVDRMSDSDFLNAYRFNRHEFKILMRELNFAYFNANNCYKTFKAKEAMLLLLYRAGAYDSYTKIGITFEMSETTVRKLVCLMMKNLLVHYAHLFRLGHNRAFLTVERLRYYADCVFQQKGIITNIAAFLDTTKIPIDRPGGPAQALFLSDHTHEYCLNYQAITAPDGLIIGIYGPLPGSADDEASVSYLKLHQALENFAFEDGKRFCVYTNKEYKSEGQLTAEYTDSRLASQGRKQENKILAESRAGTEQSFAGIKNSFGGLFDRRAIIYGKSDTFSPVIISTFFYNVMCCLHGTSACGSTNRCIPPKLEQYLSTPCSIPALTIEELKDKTCVENYLDMILLH